MKKNNISPAATPTPERNDVSRRKFLKTAGAVSVAVGAALSGCRPAQNEESILSSEGTSSASLTGAPNKELMEYRTNPNSKDRVSLLGYGCMRLPALRNPPKEGNHLDQEQANRLIDHALAHGVNFFDCSPAYLKGYCEETVGKALSRHPRSSYYVSTKLSNFSQSTWTREATLGMYEESFKKLQVDYIDYLLLHGLGRGGLDNYRKRYVDNGVMETLIADRKRGRIRNLGFSFHGSQEAFDELMSLHDEVHWDFVLIQMNYVDWRHAQEQNKRNSNAEYLYSELEKRGIPVLIMEPLLGGRLAKLPTHIVNRLKQRRPEDSVASWAFRFCGSHPGVLTVLSGMSYMEHLEDNLRTYSPLVPLSEDDLAYLEDTAKLILKYPTIPCNDCQYCMPCPYGVDIPSILLHYNKCVNEGNVPKELGTEEYKQSRRAYLVSYDRSVEKLRQADRCIGCNACIPMCPQNIKIPNQLHRIADFVEKLKQEKL